MIFGNEFGQERQQSLIPQTAQVSGIVPGPPERDDKTLSPNSTHLDCRPQKLYRSCTESLLCVRQLA